MLTGNVNSLNYTPFFRGSLLSHDPCKTDHDLEPLVLPCFTSIYLAIPVCISRSISLSIALSFYVPIPARHA